jgi:hypothetical protein
MSYWIMRRPRTTQERRANQEWRVVDFKWCRASRHPKRLVDAWDDIMSHHDNCWKSHRLTQYRVKDMK